MLENNSLVNTGIRFPDRDEKIPDDVCQAIEYIYEALYGKNKPVDFDLNQLITVMGFLGADYYYPTGTVLQFKIQDNCTVTIHYKTKKQGRFTCPLKYLQGNSEFANSFRANNDFSLTFREYIELLHEKCGE